MDAFPIQEFELLSHDLRLGILEALMRHRQTNPEHSALSYSELLDATGNPDSGRFNYHLTRLHPQFVRKTDTGYRLSISGKQIMGAVLAGTYDDSNVTLDGELDQACPICTEPLDATFDSGLLHVACPDEHVNVRTGLPSGATTGRSIQNLAAIVSITIRQDVERALEGICPLCYGHMSTSVEYRDEYLFTAHCTRCGMLFSAPVGFSVISHPAVVAFLYEQGYDVRRHPPWTFKFCLCGESVRQVGTDPFRIQVRLDVEGSELDVELDGAGRVIETSSALD